MHSPTLYSSEINKQQSSQPSKPNHYPSHPILKRKRKHQSRSLTLLILKTTEKRRNSITGLKSERGERRKGDERGKWRLKIGNKRLEGGRDGLLRK